MGGKWNHIDHILLIMQTKLENLCQTKSCASLSKYFFFFFSERESGVFFLLRFLRFVIFVFSCCLDLGIWIKRTKGMTKGTSGEKEWLLKADVRETDAASV